MMLDILLPLCQVLVGRNSDGERIGAIPKGWVHESVNPLCLANSATTHILIMNAAHRCDWGWIYSSYNPLSLTGSSGISRCSWLCLSLLRSYLHHHRPSCSEYDLNTQIEGINIHIPSAPAAPSKTRPHLYQAAPECLFLIGRNPDGQWSPVRPCRASTCEEWSQRWRVWTWSWIWWLWTWRQGWSLGVLQQIFLNGGWEVRKAASRRENLVIAICKGVRSEFPAIILHQNWGQDSENLWNGEAVRHWPSIILRMVTEVKILTCKHYALFCYF